MKNEGWGKELPYKESPEYIKGLIARCKETAAAKSKSTLRPWIYGAAASVAIAAGLAGIFLIPGQEVSKKTDSLTALNASPVESFLAGISDEEAAQLFSYEIEEIPEY